MAKAKEIIKDKGVWKKAQAENEKMASTIGKPIEKPHKKRGFKGSSEIISNDAPALKAIKESGDDLKDVAKRNVSYIKKQKAVREKIRGKAKAA